MFLASTTLAAGGGSISPGGSTAAMRSPAIAMSRTAGRGSGASGSRPRARCRGDRPEWSVPFENEPGERVALEVPADQREQVDAVIEIVVDPLRGVVGVLDYRHLGNGATQQLARFILDRDRNHGDLVSGAVYAEHFGRQACDVHLRLVRVPPRRYIGERRRPFMADCADDAAMPAGDGIAAGPGIGLLHVPGGENALILDQDHTDAVVARLVGPDA